MNLQKSGQNGEPFNPVMRRNRKSMKGDIQTMKPSRMLLVAASILFALAPGFISANRALMSKSDLQEAHQRLEAYAHR
jgi:hypothetical protein